MAGQSLRYEKGAPLLYAETSQARMFVSYQPRDKKSGYLWLGISNAGTAPFNVDERAISASMNGAPVRIQTYADRSAENKRAAMWRGIGAALAAGANGYAAGASGGRTQFNGTAYGNGQITNYSGTVYDPNAAAAANARASRQNAANVAMVKQANAADADALQGRALLAQTVDPGAVVTGDVVVELPKASVASPLVVSIAVAGERVEAVFADAGSCPPPPSFDSMLDALRAKLRASDPQYDARLPEVMKRVATYDDVMSKMDDGAKIAFLERLYWSTDLAPATTGRD
jgi:hypothetical protein